MTPPFVAFRSATGRSFVERKTTFVGRVLSDNSVRFARVKENRNVTERELYLSPPQNAHGPHSLLCLNSFSSHLEHVKNQLFRE